MISSNYYRCSESELINNVFNSKSEMICELGDRKLMQWCKKNSKGDVDWCRHLDIDKNGCISKDSFYSSAILMKRNSSKFTVLMNAEHSITKIHSDMYGILSDPSVMKKCDIILFLSTKENYEGSYLTKLIRTVVSCRRANNASGNVFVYLREPSVCIFIMDINIGKNPLSALRSIKKIEFVEYINEVTSGAAIGNSSAMKYKQMFVDVISKYIQVVPYITYQTVYNESFRFTTIVIMDNRCSNKWLTMSIINTNKSISSSKMKIGELGDKDIAYTSTKNFDSYVKSGFCVLDFSEITSASKVNALVKRIISSIEKIYPEILSEIKYYCRSAHKSKNDKKVRFSTKVHISLFDNNTSITSNGLSGSKPSFSVKKYKNGKPVSILKKKSSY